jgi:benzoate-CoA ligase family protein
VRAADLPLRYNAVEILEHNLADRAGKRALDGPAGERTFAEVAEEANRVGNGLRELGVRAEDRVAILLPDSPEWAAVFFGTLKVGAVALGVNTLLTPAEHAYILRDGKARVLITDGSLAPAVAEALESAAGGLPDLEQVIVVGDSGRAPADEALAGGAMSGGALAGPSVPSRDYSGWIRAQRAELAPAATHREDFCTLNYSSGTTGTPKGILHAHKDLALSARLWGVGALGLREDDVAFSNAKLFFTYGLGGSLIFPWSVGASAVLNPGAGRDTRAVLAILERYRPTIFFNAPTGYAAMLAMPDLAREHDLSSLRLCVSAGEALPAPVWHGWKETTGVEIIDGIGSTELFHIFISNRPGKVRPGSSGTPVDGYAMRIVDEAGEALPTGEIGNLLVRGETAALFYLHQEALTRRTFLGEWVWTGDKYRVDEEGYYWHAGRTDDMLKVGGIWVSPVEVEGTLLAHPAVTECAVVGVPDSVGLIKPKAWVVPAPGFEPTGELAEELIAYCGESMAAYKRPRWIEFVEELPKTATGKIRRFKLRGEGGTSA